MAVFLEAYYIEWTELVILKSWVKISTRRLDIMRFVVIYSRPLRKMA
jgi:hypothetical protein